MWLTANVCEPRAGQWDAVMLCQEMQGVIMDTDEMQHAGCRNYACDLTTLNELQSCRRGNSYGEWWWPPNMLVPGRLWVLGLGSNCEILVCCVQTLQCVLWGEGRAVEQEGGSTQWKYWDRVWRLGSFPPPPPPPSPTPHSCCININKYIGRLANSLH